MAHHTYARATPPNAATSAVFGEFMNHSDKDRYIVSATTDAAGKVELHDVIKEGDVMKMRQVEQITICKWDCSFKTWQLTYYAFQPNETFCWGR